MKTSYSA